MVSLLITDTHLVCAEWSNTSDNKKVLTNLCTVSFNVSISSLYQRETEINSTIEIAFNQLIETIRLHGKEVSIIVHRDLLNEELIITPDHLHYDDLYDYFLWRQEQKWGKNYKDNTNLFVQTYPNTSNQYLLVECNLYLIEIVKLTISEHSGIPVWMGSATTPLFDLNTNDTVYVFDDKQSYQYIYRGNNRCSLGRIKFKSGDLQISGYSKSSDESDFNNLTFNLMDVVSDNKLSKWESKSFKQLSFINSIVMEGVSVPKSSTSGELNLLAVLINFSNNKSNINFFNVSKINNWIPKMIKEPKKPKKKSKQIMSSQTKSKESKHSPIYIFLTLVIMFAGLIYLNNRESLSDLAIFNLFDNGIESIKTDEQDTIVSFKNPAIDEILLSIIPTNIETLLIRNDSLLVNIQDSIGIEPKTFIVNRDVDNFKNDSLSVEILMEKIIEEYPTAVFHKPLSSQSTFIPIMVKVLSKSLPVEELNYITSLSRNLTVEQVKLRRDPNTFEFITVFYLSISTD